MPSKDESLATVETDRIFFTETKRHNKDINNENNITIHGGDHFGATAFVHQTTQTFNHHLNFAGDKTARDQLKAVVILVQVVCTLVRYEREDVFHLDAYTCQLARPCCTVCGAVGGGGRVT